MAEKIPVVDRSVRTQEIATDDDEWQFIVDMATAVAEARDLDDRTAILAGLFEILIQTDDMLTTFGSFDEMHQHFKENHPAGVVKVLVRM